MIVAKVRIAEDGLLVEFAAEGHAGFAARGSDIVCAAFTVLARTAFRAFAGLPGVRVEDRAPRPGSVDFHLESVPDGQRERAAGISAFLLQGLADLAREYPSRICVESETVRRE